MLVGPIKAIYLSLTLLHSIITKSNRSSYVMVQNPPAIPTLPIIQICRLVIGFNLIIDWHNTGYTILALKLNSDYHPMVRLARWIEATFGRDAYLHLFVTRAEKIHLSKVWDLRGEKKVFYDRPPAEFCRLSVERIHSFFCKSSFNSDPKLIETFNSEPPLLEETLITFREDEGGRIKFKPNRPVLLISTTSWTVDEDFHILIDALSIYVNRKRSVDKNLPKLLCFITGKGPLKSYYQKQIERRALKEDWRLVGVECHLVWLDDQEDYQRLLGSCDLGLSLHQSSSGLDLPMKVVDMFGCDLPVCAKNFDCLSELVKHDKNGLVFDRAEELASQIAELLKDFSLTEGGSKLNQLRLGIRSLRYGQEEEEREWTDWDSNWKVDVLDSLKL
ncbi:family 33 glycosyltransferase [Phakopsora pachyrhizi]|nr:family 33 glycosyltransferase [Phakopsora pachyrhizi]